MGHEAVCLRVRTRYAANLASGAAGFVRTGRMSRIQMLKKIISAPATPGNSTIIHLRNHLGACRVNFAPV